MKQKATMVIAVDFDGTVVDHRFPSIGQEAPGAVRWMRRWLELGASLILFTMRSGAQLAEAAAWFEQHEIPLWGINKNPDQHEWTQSPKVYAQVYIDDAAVGCPTVRVPGFERPCVAWDLVGPLVEERLTELQRLLEAPILTERAS